ncbi:MAG: radical SAM protein [Deltaproteobacteria bacterium]|jgi:radical SAM protein with 4Fe4S-binding SPASM domain|nr:radical SAM protein [Deltaproteobacteria bacterium]MCL5879778.1 radical SAM protein [Deltaproteobacteria bacterium]MDA8303939.1 radical SAM protein [Deltaproteobacteria bacterium]
MLRVTDYIKKSLEPDSQSGKSHKGRLLIWNITNDCNLSCEHCYSSSGKSEIAQKLTPELVLSTVKSLKKADVKAVILSGGEPLMSPFLFDIAVILKDNGFQVHLSTNGTMINENNIGRIKSLFNYVGISIDGTEKTHDRFRQREGAYEASLKALRLLKNKSVNVGLRTSLTAYNYKDIAFIFEMAKKEDVKKLYISHLVYSGRGSITSEIDKTVRKKISSYVIETAFNFVKDGILVDIVTGNNEPDAILLLEMFKSRCPEFYDNMREKILEWGGNQSGKRIINIDYSGFVKPDPFFNYKAGNIKDRDFFEIISEDKLFSKLREMPRKLKGRCEKCNYLEVCNGGSRARAYAVYGDYFQEDPACFM